MTNTQSDQWENRLAIAELLTKYFRALDDKDFETETFAAIFTEDATVRANLVAIHLWADGFGDPSSLDKHFSAGGVITAAARRKKDGWRLLSLENRVVWRTGSGFGAMLKTNKE